MQPELVTSPKDMIEAGSLKVIFIGQQNGATWSVATMMYDGKPRVGIRWNGSDDHLGNPTSHGQATWYMLPDTIGHPIADLITQMKKELER